MDLKAFNSLKVVTAIVTIARKRDELEQHRPTLPFHYPNTSHSDRPTCDAHDLRCKFNEHISEQAFSSFPSECAVWVGHSLCEVFCVGY